MEDALNAPAMKIVLQLIKYAFWESANASIKTAQWILLSALMQKWDPVKMQEK